MTQVSANRLSQLEAQCRDWDGPLSAVVYTSVIENTTAAGLGEQSKTHLADVVRALEQFTLMVGGCRASLCTCRWLGSGGASAKLDGDSHFLKCHIHIL